jgi:UDP-sugar diphosphatase
MVDYNRIHSDIREFALQPLRESYYVKASLATYKQNGKAKTWEVVQAHDSVSILIYHTCKKAFVLVRQFRPAVYVNNGEGMTIELCAGLVDKQKSLEEIAREEIVEECGYDVAVESIEKISSFYTSVGFAGGRQTLYYVEVDEKFKVNEGGGIEDELIEVIYLPIDEAKAFMYDDSIAKTPGLMFAFMWWFERKSVL